MPLARMIQYEIPNSLCCEQIPLKWGKFGPEIELPFTTIGIRLTDQVFENGVLYRFLHNEDSALRAFRELCSVIEANNSTLAKVQAAGPGPTERSRKIKFEAVYQEADKNSQRSVTDTKQLTRTHSMTVPVSMVKVIDGHLYAQRWFLLKKMAERPKKLYPQRICGSWDGEDQLWNTVFKPLVEEITHIRLASEKSEQRQQICAEKQPDKAKTAAPPKDILAPAAKKSGKAPRKPRAALATLEVPTVEWDEWVDNKTRWGKQKVKRTSSAENCVLRFSGSRIYIDLPDGRVLIKAASNVRYESSLNLRG